jgi:hypothetical protein
MNQILHIFSKDVRRHWPEILISLALLALFTRHELHPWQNSNGFSSFSPYFFILEGRYIIPATVLFWAFLIIRVVQGESLVGDRQWWVTKPYEWWSLLAAKLLFILIFITVPLFHVHLLLLRHFGFPVLSNLPTLLLTQLALYFVLFLPAMLLASLTKNFGQSLLTVACILLLAAGIAWLATKFPSGEMESPPAIVENFQEFLLWGSVVAVPVWQFARRRRWVSVAALLGVLAVSSLISLIVPNANTMDKGYPRVEAQTSPAKITIQRPAEMTGRRNANPLFDVVPEVYLHVPITVSGVAPGTMVMVDVMKITTDLPEESRWSLGWKYQHVELWPEDQLKSLSYEVARKEYEKSKTKPLNLHIELALSQYQEGEPRMLLIPPGKFADETLGICRTDPRETSFLQCLKPFHAPGLMATFDPKDFPCPGDRRSYNVQEDSVSHAWEFSNHYGFPSPNYTPIDDYSIWFRPVSLLADLEAKPGQRTKNLVLCPGSEIRLARPELKRQLRIQLDLPNVRLQDLVESDWQ